MLLNQPLFLFMLMVRNYFKRCEIEDTNIVTILVCMKAQIAMRTIYQFILLFFFLGMTGCVPSKEFIDTTSESDQISKLNEKLATQRVEIKLSNGESLKPDSSRIAGSNLYYYIGNNVNTKLLSEVSFIKTSPKLSYSTLIGVPLIIYGSVTSYLFLDGKTSSEHWAIIPNLPALIFGLGVFTIGNNVETDIYYLTKKTKQK